MSSVVKIKVENPTCLFKWLAITLKGFFFYLFIFFSVKAWTTARQCKSSCNSPCDLYYQVFIQTKPLLYSQWTERPKMSAEELTAGTKNLKAAKVYWYLLFCHQSIPVWNTRSWKPCICSCHSYTYLTSESRENMWIGWLWNMLSGLNLSLKPGFQKHAFIFLPWRVSFLWQMWQIKKLCDSGQYQCEWPVRKVIACSNFILLLL